MLPSSGHHGSMWLAIVRKQDTKLHRLGLTGNTPKGSDVGSQNNPKPKYDLTFIWINQHITKLWTSFQVGGGERGLAH